MSFDFSQTYLYKLHKLNNSLDRVFDQTLRAHAGLGLSQFTLLLSVDQHQPVSQQRIASFLGISPGAVSRQVEIAQKSGWIEVKNIPTDRRSQRLHLTASGTDKMKEGTKTLQERVFQIFDDENAQTNLMAHIDTLQSNVDSINKR